jgi:hypothetical protein
MTDTCRNLLDRVEPKDLTQIALQMLFTIERMELIIPEITDTIRKALEQARPTVEPVPEGIADDDEIDEEAATVIPWLLEEAAQAADADQSYAAGKLTLAAQLLGERRPTPQRKPEPPTDEALANFSGWFCRNYPGPDTIIHKPEWHAPKVFRAAADAIARYGTPTIQPVPVAEPVAYLHRQGDYCEVLEIPLSEDEKARGWTETPLYSRHDLPIPNPTKQKD